MKIASNHHGNGICNISLFLILLLSPAISFVAAQPPSPGNNDEGDTTDNMTSGSTMAIIIVVFVSSLFIMGFISTSIRHCLDSSSGDATLITRRPVAARGLHPSILETFPILSYSEVKDHRVEKEALECAVCLNEFEESETLRLIPKCDHVFHPECIDTWLKSHVTCPVCRADLAPQAGDEPAQVPGPVYNNVERGLESNEIVIDVGENEPERAMNRSSSLNYPSRPPRAGSIRSPKFSCKFRSHSTGHSLVQPVQNLERYTLRLPEGVRKEVMDRAALKRTGSLAATLPREGSLRKGYRTPERSNRGAKSDPWIFFSRGLSFNMSPKATDEGGGAGVPVKLPSFGCLEPKTEDETGLISGDSGKNPV